MCVYVYVMMLIPLLDFVGSASDTAAKPKQSTWKVNLDHLKHPILFSPFNLILHLRILMIACIYFSRPTYLY